MAPHIIFEAKLIGLLMLTTYYCGVTSYIGLWVHRRLYRNVRPSLQQSAGQMTEFELLQQALYQGEIDEHREESWLESLDSLPFDCTGCGRCCQTKGNVYCSPEEISKAAAYTQMTPLQFISTYAEDQLDAHSKDEQLPWILLKNKETTKGPACCFLDVESNKCTIYDVRPVQCSTYPFWSKILSSEQSWDDEVRKQDDDIHSKAPIWTAEKGGCEGMRPVNRIAEDSNIQKGESVPITAALEQLSWYKRAERRSPFKVSRPS